MRIRNLTLHAARLALADGTVLYLPSEVTPRTKPYLATWYGVEAALLGPGIRNWNPAASVEQLPPYEEDAILVAEEAIAVLAHPSCLDRPDLYAPRLPRYGSAWTGLVSYYPVDLDEPAISAAFMGSGLAESSPAPTVAD